MRINKCIAFILFLILCNNIVLASDNYHFWIDQVGPRGPIFSGPHQYPFICTTQFNGLGQAKIDNKKGKGTAIFPEVDSKPNYKAKPIGFSEHCDLPTRIDYFYFDKDHQNFLPYTKSTPPANIERIQLGDQRLKFIVRVERGSINRYIYSIAMLAPFKESTRQPKTLNNSAWNGSLVYKFKGGVGIGRWQGRLKLTKSQALLVEALRKGYAVAFSTGTISGTHYNLQRSAETAIMLKKHFIAIYGKPRWTIGIGASGGAVQQYHLAENYPNVLDGAIALMAYPDMVSQIIHVSDCELLEYYFDQSVMINPNSFWKKWSNRQLIEGMSTNNHSNKPPWNMNKFTQKPGSSTCVQGWRGSIPMAINPAWFPKKYGQALKQFRYSAKTAKSVKWNHWNDLENVYPHKISGFVQSIWDNVGVQYGLLPLKTGKISVQQFLELNACVGSWKAPQNMKVSRYPWNNNKKDMIFGIDPWHSENMQVEANCRNGKPSPRSRGSRKNLNAALSSGHIFRGKAKIPILDARYYLDPVLDIHYAQASFASRLRITRAIGKSEKQAIWMAQCKLNPKNAGKQCPQNLIEASLQAMQEHLSSSRGSFIMDACFDKQGKILFQGPQVWDGIINQKRPGACTQLFPIYSTSRIKAGADPGGDIFQCKLKPVNQALRDGTYGKVDFAAQQIKRLKIIFPSGVCVY